MCTYTARCLRCWRDFTNIKILFSTARASLLLPPARLRHGRRNCAESFAIQRAEDETRGRVRVLYYYYRYYCIILRPCLVVVVGPLQVRGVHTETQRCKCLHTSSQQYRIFTNAAVGTGWRRRVINRPKPGAARSPIQR